MAAKLSQYDRDHIADILAGHGDWFSAHLIRLIAKADRGNRFLLWDVFPDHVETYERWLETGTATEPIEGEFTQ